MIPKLLNVKELATQLNVSQQCIYNMLHENKIPHVRLGCRYLFRPEQVEEWLNENTHGLLAGSTGT